VSVEERVIEIVSEQMGVAKDQVTRDTSFVNDLGAEKIGTVGQAINYIEEHSK
jgi:acyl carrier protein